MNAVRQVSIDLLSRRLLTAFVAMLVANGIPALGVLNEAAKYGKLGVMAAGILLLSNQTRLLRFFRENGILLLFSVLALSFCVYQALVRSVDPEIILTNVTFPFYIYFFYLLVNTISLDASFSREDAVVHIGRIVARNLNGNFLLWTVAGLALGTPLWHQLDDRVGLGLFYNNYIQLGIFGACGAVVHALLLKAGNTTKANVFWLLLYLSIVVLSNSRNAQLIAGAGIFLLYFRQLLRVAVRFRVILLAALITTYFVIDISAFLQDPEIQKATTGRSSIWNYIIRYYEHTSVFRGYGIFGLNGTILQQSKTDNYYFSRIDFLYFHNSYLEIFAAAGLFGLIAFLWAQFRNIRQAGNSVLNGILGGIFIGAFFESYLVQPVILVTTVMWLLFFLNHRLYQKAGKRNA